MEPEYIHSTYDVKQTTGGDLILASMILLATVTVLILLSRQIEGQAKGSSLRLGCVSSSHYKPI